MDIETFRKMLVVWALMIGILLGIYYIKISEKPCPECAPCPKEMNYQRFNDDRYRERN